MSSNFTLRRHYPVKVEYSATEEAVPQKAKLDVQYRVTAGANTQNPLDWRVTLDVVFEGKAGDKEIVKGNVVFVGYFDIPDTIKEPDRMDFAARNGASVLYSATRELLTNISSRSPNRLVTLPLTQFQNLTVDKSAPTEEIIASGI